MVYFIVARMSIERRPDGIVVDILSKGMLKSQMVIGALSICMSI